MKDFFYNFLARLTFSRLQLWKYLPDRFYLKIAFWNKMHCHLDLDNPKTFSEKLQWLKLHDRRPEYSVMVDKYEAKKYVASIIGEEYIVPTLGVYDSADDIDWDRLPNEFVLKCTHDSGGLVICRDKMKLNKQEAIDKLNTALHRNFWKTGREWPYKNVKPRILAEKLLKDVRYPKDLPDYKWFCFDGEPKFCQVIQDRNTKETIDFFDTDWHHQEFVGLNPAAGPAAGPAALPPSKPANLDLQVRIARKLSEGTPFSRIDLYEVNDQEFFGEITLYPASGFGKFSPSKYNEMMGQLLSLPSEMGGVKP